MSEVRRLFVRALPEWGGVVTLDPATSRHARVLRLREGTAVRLFDGSGREAEARILSTGEEAVTCEAGLAEERAFEGPRVVLVQAMPKGSKLESIVRMATELGVAEIHLASSGRTVAQPDDKRATKRAERLARIAVEAARQAGRTHVPAILPPAELMDVAARAPSAAWRVVLWERATEPFEAPAGVRGAWVIVGPEGGLASAEVDALGSIGYCAAGLGPSILRVETAAPVAVALALDRLGGLRRPSAGS